MPGTISPQTKAAIERKAKKGETKAKVARDLELSLGTVRKYWVEPHTEEYKPRQASVSSWERSPAEFERFYVQFSGMYFPSHWKEWVRDYFENTRLLINVPPRHGKSKLFSVWIPMFEACLNPDIQILLISQTSKLAQKWALEIAWHLERNEPLIAEFGPFKSDESTYVWRPQSGELMHAKRSRAITMGDVTFQIKGRTQQLLGAEADLLIVDDITDRDISRSETERQKLSDTFKGEIMTRRTPSGKVVVVGQRVHFLDIYGELADQRLTRVPGEPKLWQHINYPAVDWDTKSVLWPEEWSFERLMETYEELASKGSTALFETMYQQNPQMDDAAMLDRAWIEGDDKHPGCWDDNRHWREPPPALVGNDRDWWKRMRIISIDPSPTQFTGFVVADVDTHKGGDEYFYRINVMEMESAKWNLRDIVSHLRIALDTYGPVDHVIFEQNAAQRWFFQDVEFRQLRKQRNLSVRGHTTTHRNKADEEFGVQSLGEAFEHGLIRLPGASQQDKRRSEVMIEEGLQYPWGPHDDILMALWFIRWQSPKLNPRSKSEQGPVQMPIGPGNPATYDQSSYGWRKNG